MHFTRPTIARAAAVALAASIAITLSACSDAASGGDTPEQGDGVPIDVGTSTLTFPTDTKANIAVFAGSGIAYQTAYQEEVEKLKTKYDIDITYFDSKFDPTTQLNQIRTAIQAGEYNAFIVENYSGEAACSLLTQDAPAANIVVSQISNPTCDQGTAEAGDDFWSPGTLNTIGAESTVTYYTGFVKGSVDILGNGDHKVAVLNGPPLVAATTNMDNAMKAAGLDPVANLNSDYTTATALQQTSDILQANPDIEAIYSVGPNITVGIVTALKQAGKAAGDVKVFEVGGTEANDALIQDGYLTMAVPYTPRTVMDTAVEQLVNAFKGDQGERYYDALNQGTATDPFFITQDTRGDYAYEY